MFTAWGTSPISRSNLNGAGTMVYLYITIDLAILQRSGRLKDYPELKDGQ